MHALDNRVSRANQDSLVPRFTTIAVMIYLLSLCAMPDAYGQRAGQSATIRVGNVTGMRTVDLNDGNAIGGALVGGAFGAALSGSSSSSRSRNRNAALGAILGGAVAGSRRSEGRVYTVATGDGTSIQVATEQKEIRVGDCVFVEQSGSSTNIRRAPATACEPETESVMKDGVVVAEMQGDASICMAARQELADAEDDAAVDRAVRKVKLLCYD